MDPQSIRDLKDPTDGELAELAARYQACRQLAIEFADIADAIELELAARMIDDEVAVPGVGLLIRRPEKRSTWRDEHASADFRRDVGTAVVRKVALDIATGELDPVKRNVAQVTVETMFDVIPAFSSIKRPGYRLGLDPKDYRTVSDVYRVTVDDGEGNHQ